MTMVTVSFGSLEAPQGRFFAGHRVNLPPADAANCIALGVCTAAPGTLPYPLSGGLPVVSRAYMNEGNCAPGSVTFSAPPVTGSSITLNGTSVGFVTSGATGLQVNIGSVAATLASLLTLLNASADANLVQAVYSVVGSTLNIYSAGILFVSSASTSPASNAVATNAGP
jgi:hypothetical protein